MKPNAGDIVMFEQPSLRFQNYVLRGGSFDRVLAVEGQRVTWKSGELEIDGKPSPFKPLVPIGKPPDCKFTVPERCCYIVPGIAMTRLPIPDAATWQQMGIVRYDRIHGEVWAIRRSVFYFVRLHPQID